MKNKVELESYQIKEFEEKLAAREFLLSEAERIGQLGAWEYNIETKLRSWSKTVFDLFEVPYDFNLKNLDSSLFFKPESLMLWREAIELASTMGTGWDHELEMITTSGKETWIRSTGEAFADEKGKINMLRGVFMNIDRYKDIQQEMLKSHEQLLKSHQQLKSFTHILSHNIRNHSSNLMLLSQFVDQTDLNEHNISIFDRINKVANGLHNTLNDLAEAIKIKEQVILKETLHFDHVLQNAMEILDTELKSNAAEITFHFEVPSVEFPKLYLESILINLLSNSLKYRNPELNPKIHIHSGSTDNGTKYLEYHDNGLGFDLSRHGERVFGLYNTFHEHKQANGVGLFMVKTQVESQGGKIILESERLKGSTFKIFFK